MNLTLTQFGTFPFSVPKLTAAGTTGAGTVYPVGLSLAQVAALYWRAQTLMLVANGQGQYAGVTQSLQINGPLPPRNALVGPGFFSVPDGLNITTPAQLTPGVGWAQTVPGGGSLTASGSSCSGVNHQPFFNLEVYLFFVVNVTPPANWPLINYANLWWPAFSLQATVTNSVPCSQGGSLSYDFNCTSLSDPNFPTPLGTCTLLGQAVPVYGPALQPAAGGFPAETRSFSGAITLAQNWSNTP